MVVKLKHNYLRTLIREMILFEKMIGPNLAFESDLNFVVSKTKWGRGGYQVICKKDDEVVGEIRFSLPLGMGSCNGVYEVTSSVSKTKGLGPLLYDIAMEISGDAGIMPDRRDVSPAAISIWEKYDNQRDDVIAISLEDCVQTSAYKEKGSEWKTSSLSKLYKKPGQTIILDELKKLNIIQFV